MSGQPRVLVLEDGETYDILQVIDVTDTLVRARAAFMFEVGEELRLRIEREGETQEVSARVRAHVGDRVTELEVFAWTTAK